MAKTVALILAGGVGNRFMAETDGVTSSAVEGVDTRAVHSSSAGLPKQFAKIGEVTLLEMSLAAFQKHLAVDEIVVVSHPDFILQTEERAREFEKVRAVVAGGKTRAESSYFGMQAVSQSAATNGSGDLGVTDSNAEGSEGAPAEDFVLIHDAVRPFVSERIISAVVEKLKAGAEAVEPIMPVTQTIVKNTPSGWVTQNRADFATVQTPQGFQFKKLLSAFEKCKQESASLDFTDDISVLQSAFPEVRVDVVDGETANRKITFRVDLG